MMDDAGELHDWGNVYVRNGMYLYCDAMQMEVVGDAESVEWSEWHPVPDEDGTPTVVHLKTGEAFEFVNEGFEPQLMMFSPLSESFWMLNDSGDVVQVEKKTRGRGARKTKSTR